MNPWLLRHLHVRDLLQVGQDIILNPPIREEGWHPQPQEMQTHQLPSLLKNRVMRLCSMPVGSAGLSALVTFS